MKATPKYNKAYRKPLIILASGSASRRQQLKDLSFDFKVEVSGIDEDIYKPQKGFTSAKMGQIALKIAQAKVEKVAQKYPQDLVMGGDQMAVLGQRIFSKPLTSAKAEKTLLALQGKTHTLFTALYLCYGKKTFSHLEVNKMSMRKLTLQEIKAYVRKARPFKCAGSYALERYGLALFEKIKTADQSAVIGFPLITLINQLIRWGIPLPFGEPLK